MRRVGTDVKCYLTLCHSIARGGLKVLIFMQIASPRLCSYYWYYNKLSLCEREKERERDAGYYSPRCFAGIGLGVSECLQIYLQMEWRFDGAWKYTLWQLKLMVFVTEPRGSETDSGFLPTAHLNVHTNVVKQGISVTKPVWKCSRWSLPRNYAQKSEQ